MTITRTKFLRIAADNAREADLTFQGARDLASLMADDLLLPDDEPGLPDVITGELIAFDDGIGDGLSRWDMFRRLQPNAGNTRTVRYRGIDVEILSEWAYRSVTIHQDGTSASFSSTGDSAGTAKMIRDLDQVIDYLRAEYAS